MGRRFGRFARVTGGRCPNGFLQDGPIKKDESIESLILRASGNCLVHRKVLKELRHFLLAHFYRVAFAVEENEAARPLRISVFSST